MFLKLLLLSIEPVFFPFFQACGITHMVSLANHYELTCYSRKLLPKQLAHILYLHSSQFQPTCRVVNLKLQFLYLALEYFFFFPFKSVLQFIKIILHSGTVLLHARSSSFVTYNDHIVCKQKRARTIFTKFTKPKILHCLWKWPIFPQFFRCWKMNPQFRGFSVYKFTKLPLDNYIYS